MMHFTCDLCGKELLPGEEKLDQLTIRHLHFFVIRRGVTRVTLTTHRLLCTVVEIAERAVRRSRPGSSEQ